jgi:hypothetical protein
VSTTLKTVQHNIRPVDLRAPPGGITREEAFDVLLARDVPLFPVVLDNPRSQERGESELVEIVQSTSGQPDASSGGDEIFSLS